MAQRKQHPVAKTHWLTLSITPAAAAAAAAEDAVIYGCRGRLQRTTIVEGTHRRARQV